MTDEFDKRLDDTVERFFRVVRSQIGDVEMAAITADGSVVRLEGYARTLLTLGRTLERLALLQDRRARKRSRG